MQIHSVLSNCSHGSTLGRNVTKNSFSRIKLWINVWYFYGIINDVTKLWNSSHYWTKLTTRTLQKLLIINCRVFQAPTFNTFVQQRHLLHIAESYIFRNKIYGFNCLFRIIKSNYAVTLFILIYIHTLCKMSQVSFSLDIELVNAAAEDMIYYRQFDLTVRQIIIFNKFNRPD